MINKINIKNVALLSILISLSFTCYAQEKTRIVSIDKAKRTITFEYEGKIKLSQNQEIKVFRHEDGFIKGRGKIKQINKPLYVADITMGNIEEFGKQHYISIVEKDWFWPFLNLSILTAFPLGCAAVLYFLYIFIKRWAKSKDYFFLVKAAFTSYIFIVSIVLFLIGTIIYSFAIGASMYVENIIVVFACLPVILFLIFFIILLFSSSLYWVYEKITKKKS